MTLTPSPLLDQHTLSLVLSELADMERPENDGFMTTDTIRVVLFEAGGYSTRQTEQVLEAYGRICSGCGKDAIYLWAGMGTDGVWGSTAGVNRFSPSCEDCSHTDGETATILAPLSFPIAPQPRQSPYVTSLVAQIEALQKSRDEVAHVLNEERRSHNADMRAAADLIGSLRGAVALQESNERTRCPDEGAPPA